MLTDLKQKPDLFFLPEVANSDFPPSQVSVQQHRKHLEVRHWINELGLESSDYQEHSYIQQNNRPLNLSPKKHPCLLKSTLNHYIPERREWYYTHHRCGIEWLLEGFCN